jgi:hypothetical protein
VKETKRSESSKGWIVSKTSCNEFAKEISSGSLKHCSSKQIRNFPPDI